MWPFPHVVTVADRGLREGILLRMIRGSRAARRAVPPGSDEASTSPTMAEISVETEEARPAAHAGGKAEERRGPHAEFAGLARASAERPVCRGGKAQQGWRSRAAFKLLELDAKFHLLRPGMRVDRPRELRPADGARSPIRQAGVGQVIGLDLLPIDPIPGVQLLQGDFNEPEMPERLDRP